MKHEIHKAEYQFLKIFLTEAIRISFYYQKPIVKAHKELKHWLQIIEDSELVYGNGNVFKGANVVLTNDGIDVFEKTSGELIASIKK